MLYREIIAVFKKILTKHINTVCVQNVELLKVKLVVHILTSGLYKAKPNWYWRPAPQAASVPLQYNPIFFIFNPTGIRSYEFKTWIYYFYILSESAPWDQLCSSTIGPGRLHILYELHTSIRWLLLASPKSLLRQSLYSCCIRAVKKLSSLTGCRHTHTLVNGEHH